MKLKYITNPNTNIQEKIRFFAHYFSFANEFLGKLPDVPFDNQLSLVDKAIFQIENNFKFCPRYVIGYLTQLLSMRDKSIEVESLLLNKIENKLNAFKASGDKKEWLKVNCGFLEDLKELWAEDNKTLFDKNFLALRSYIKCEHNLTEHKNKIKYITRTLVSLFRHKAHTKESLDTYIDRLISDDMYEFPFPPEILELRNKDEYKEATKTFLANRNFDQQFEGLRNLYIAENYKNGYFFFVIENCIIDERIRKQFKVTFENVTFISTDHSDLEKLKRNVEEYDKKYGEKTFPVFFGDERLLAYINVGYENKKSKKESALKYVSEELLYLNQYIDAELKVNPLHFLCLDSFEEEFWSAGTSLLKERKYRIRQFDLEEFQSNVYEYLRDVHSPAKGTILDSEKTFLKAFARDEVEYYWIYIENILAPLSLNTEDMGKDFSKLLLSLLSQLRDELFFKIGLMLSPFGFSYTEEGLDREDVFTIQEEICTNQNFLFDLEQYKDKVKSAHLKDLIDKHQNFLLPVEIHKWKTHFTFLLLDLYAYRNCSLHTGNVNEYAKIKLSAVLPKLISRARWSIIKGCKKNPNLSYIELIQTLTK